MRSLVVLEQKSYKWKYCLKILGIKKGSLTGTDVMATDLRASSALVLAALVCFWKQIYTEFILDREVMKIYFQKF